MVEHVGTKASELIQAQDVAIEKLREECQRFEDAAGEARGFVSDMQERAAQLRSEAAVATAKADLLESLSLEWGVRLDRALFEDDDDE